MGQAVVAAGAGSDVMWWNPALISRGPREVALNVTQTFATQGGGSDAAGAIVFAARDVGAFGLTFRYVNTGQQDASPGDCLLYTSDAADERSSVDLGGR